MALAQLLVAALLFASGGLFSKLSNGVTRPGATAMFLALFAGGAWLQALAMKRTDLGVAYIFVLGAEAVITVILSSLVLGEHYTASRLGAIALVVIGIAWLRVS
jgi:quaternary ammonium compound-resistance protein SugE